MNQAHKIRVVGLTGGIGSGKSSVSKFFSKLGITVVDADQLSRDVIEPGTPGNLELQQVLAKQYFDLSGALNRKLLRENIFSQPDLITSVENVIHPRVKTSIFDSINLAQQQKEPYIILEIPLLFETGLEELVDEIIVVDCSESLQITRASTRDQTSDENIKQIIARQVSRKERLKRSDHIINNSSSLEILSKQVAQLNKMLSKPLS